MAKPLQVDRDRMLARDDHKCVRCGDSRLLEANHRRGVGMGGSKVKPPCDDLCTACTWCNADFERVLSIEALVYGWKVKRWVLDPDLPPMLDKPTGQWRRLHADGTYTLLSQVVAVEQMRALYGDEYDGWAAQVRARWMN